MFLIRQYLTEYEDTAEAHRLFKEFEEGHPKLADEIFGQVWHIYGERGIERYQDKCGYDFGRCAFYNRHPCEKFEFKPELIALAIERKTSDLDRCATDSTFCAEESRMRRDRRCVEVIQGTLSALNLGRYTTPSGQTRNFTFAPSVQNTRFYRDGGPISAKQPRYTTLLEVRAQNCVAAAYDLSANGSSTLVLNLANSNKCGGAYLDHAGTQEEELFRCTTLAAALDKTHGFQSRDFYPIHRDDHAGRGGGVYNPQVTLFRMGGERDYEWLEEPAQIAVATFAAYEKPPLDFRDKTNPRLTGEQLKWTKEKIRTILRMAYENSHDSLVLGALGCGVFGNPPQHIAELFMELIQKEYRFCFNKVVFAVMEDFSQGLAHNPEGNFKPFARVVQQHGGVVYRANGELL